MCREAARAVLLAAVVVGCSGGGGGAKADAAGKDAVAGIDAPAPSAQVPPVGQKALEPWLAAGTYKAWTCESRISPPRADPDNPAIVGSHGRQRVCSNAALLGSTDGPYPVGAASVKEQYVQNNGVDEANGYAVGLKIAPGLGDNTWYWYERVGRLATLPPVADGVGDQTCGTDCHQFATRDNVFIRAMP